MVSTGSTLETIASTSSSSPSPLPTPPPDHLAKLLTEFDSARSYSLALVEDLSDDQVAWRPNEQSSAIGWHLGHQAAVNHYLVRNLTAAEETFNASFDAIFDSATPERDRGDLPSLDGIIGYREAIASSTRSVVERIASGNVGAPLQLEQIAVGLLRAVINHEYQHATWIREVRDTMVETPSPTPDSNHIVDVEGYWMLAEVS